MGKSQSQGGKPGPKNRGSKIRKNATFFIFWKKFGFFSKNFCFLQIFWKISKTDPKMAQKIKKIKISKTQKFLEKFFWNFEKFHFFSHFFTFFQKKVPKKSKHRNTRFDPLLAKGNWGPKYSQKGGFLGVLAVVWRNANGGLPRWENGRTRVE